MVKKKGSISTGWRILWHIYRSPIARFIKPLRRAGVRSEITRRRNLARGLVVLPKQQIHAEELIQNGYAVVSDVMDPEITRSLSEAALEKHQRAQKVSVKQVSSHKDFWTRLLDEDMQDGTLPTDSPFVTFALQPAVLAILARAFGELPQLDYVLLTLSRNSDKALSYSQLWHRDHDDTRVIKLFVYLTDVLSLDDGPFTFIPGPASDRFGFSLRSHRSDKALAGRVEAAEVTAMVAPRLSAFMVETSRCLHMGSRLSPGHERLLYTATYTSVPRLLPEPPPRFRLTGCESDVVKCVLSAT